MRAELMQPDLSVLEAMEVPCDVKTAFVAFGKVRGNPIPCEFAARWAANFPCCGGLLLVCDDHANRKEPWFCKVCQARHRDLVEWREL